MPTPFLDKLMLDRQQVQKQLKVLQQAGAAFAPAKPVIQVTEVAQLPRGVTSPFGYTKQDPRNADQMKRLPAPNAAGSGPMRSDSPATPPVGLPNPLSPDAAPSDVNFAALAEEMARSRGTVFASILCQSEPPVTSVGNFIIGSQLAAADPSFIEVYKNSRPYPIAVIATFEPGTNTGVLVDVSYSKDQSTKDRIWTLSSSGLVKTGGILLAQEQALYMRQNEQSLTLTDEILRVLIFDPVQFFGSSILP